MGWDQRRGGWAERGREGGGDGGDGVREGGIEEGREKTVKQQIGSRRTAKSRPRYETIQKG